MKQSINWLIWGWIMGVVPWAWLAMKCTEIESLMVLGLFIQFIGVFFLMRAVYLDVFKDE